MNDMISMISGFVRSFGLNETRIFFEKILWKCSEEITSGK